MRRTRLVGLAGSLVLMAALLVPSAAMASTGAAAPSAQGTPSATTIAPIKLACALVLQNQLGPAKAVRANVCTWTAPAGVDVKTYRLWRIKDAPAPQARVLLATIASGQPLRYADKAIKSGHVYSYFVAGVGADGKRVALSNRVKISIGRSVQAIRLACAYSADRDGVACHWTRTTRPAASRYVLVRSVDGAARQRIYSTWIRGLRHHLDTDVKPGQTVRYAVLAVTRSGRVVALGGPIVVHVPDAAPAAR